MAVPVSSGSCPDSAVLEEFALQPDGEGELQGHVADCARCQERLARLERDNALLREFLTATTGRDRGESSPPVLQIPGYLMLGELHRGGQGVVYHARQESTGREVAIKVMREGPLASIAERARFVREVSALVQLDHPNIVTIHDSGQILGWHYFVMDYVRGVALDEYPSAAGTDWSQRQQAIELLATIGEAVNAAHVRGIIHRDLKPGNILVAVDGRPSILDFGLAKTMGTLDTTMTRAGQFVGSLPWSSPEQTLGQGELVDVRSDVYSLGVIGYQVLTGEFPYDVTGSVTDVAERIRTAPPNALSRGGRQFDRDLETIIRKCLSKEPERRYQSAGELARDLRRYLAGEAIEARRDSTWYVMRKSLRRHRLPVAASVALIVLLLAFAVQRSRHATRLEAALTRATIERARAEGRTGNLVLAEELLGKILLPTLEARIPAPGATGMTSVDNAAYWALWELYARQPSIASWTVDRPIARLQFGGDGRRVLVSTGDGSVQLWEWTDGELRSKQPIRVRGSQLTATAFSLDGTTVAAADAAGSIYILEPVSLERHVDWKAHEGPVERLALNQSGQRVVSCSGDVLRIWRTADGSLLGEHEFDSPVSLVRYSPDGMLLVAARPRESAIAVINTSTSSRRADLDLTAIVGTYDVAERIGDVAVSPDGRYVAAGCYRYLCVWDLDRGEMVSKQWHQMPVNAVCYDPAGEWVAAAAGRGIHFWSAAANDRLYSYHGHTEDIRALAVQPASRLLNSAGSDGTVRTWECRPGACAGTFDQREIHCVRYSPDGRFLTACGESQRSEKGLVLRNGVTGEALLELAAPSAAMSQLAFSQDGNRLAVASYKENRIRLWDLGLRQFSDVEVGTGGAASVAFSPDGNWLAVGSNHDPHIDLVRVSSGKVVDTIVGSGGRVPSICFSADGRLMVSTEHAGTAVVREFSSRREVLRIEAHRGPARAVRFGPDNQSLITAGDDSLLRIWQVSDGALIGELRGHHGAVYGLDVSHDGRMISSGGHDGTIRLWSVPAGRLLATLDLEGGVISTLAFHPDGTRLAFGSFGGPYGVIDLTHYDRHIRGSLQLRE